MCLKNGTQDEATELPFEKVDLNQFAASVEIVLPLEKDSDKTIIFLNLAGINLALNNSIHGRDLDAPRLQTEVNQ